MKYNLDDDQQDFIEGLKKEGLSDETDPEVDEAMAKDL